MQARSALFDLYGDHLRSRGCRAPVAALVRLLDPLGIAAPAVRTAISRMVRQGWLLPVQVDGGPGYQLSARAMHRLDEAAARIYRVGLASWDGRFDLVVMTPPERRTDRNRIAATLSWLGYGRIDPSTWVSVRASDEVDTLLKEAGIAFERFTATHAAGTSGAAALVRRAWDLSALAASYEDFVARQEESMAAVTRHSSDQVAYAARFRLLHEWRSFLFRDPHLPPALLPAPWPGTTAAEFFDRHEARLRPAAERFVESCLGRQKIGSPRAQSSSSGSRFVTAPSTNACMASSSPSGQT